MKRALMLLVGALVASIVLSATPEEILKKCDAARAQCTRLRTDALLEKGEFKLVEGQVRACNVCVERCTAVINQSVRAAIAAPIAKAAATQIGTRIFKSMKKQAETCDAQRERINLALTHHCTVRHRECFPQHLKKKFGKKEHCIRCRRECMWWHIPKSAKRNRHARVITMNNECANKAK